MWWVLRTQCTLLHTSQIAEDVDVYYSGHRAKKFILLKVHLQRKKNDCIQYTVQFPYKIPKGRAGLEEVELLLVIDLK